MMEEAPLCIVITLTFYKFHKTSFMLCNFIKWTVLSQICFMYILLNTSFEPHLFGIYANTYLEYYKILEGIITRFGPWNNII